MQTTKPFLYIAVDNGLQKSWREDVHPRDTFGKFSTVKGGSRVVTKTGKTGVVEEAGSTHHTVRYDDGKKAKVAKDNVLHANDHKKVTEAKAAADKKAKANKAKAAKTAATKTHNKTNATGKTGASKTVADPTAKKPAAKPAPKTKAPAKAPAKAKPDAVSKQLNKNAKTAAKTSKKKASEDVKAYNKKASAEKKAIRQSKKERDMSAPVLKRQVNHIEDKEKEVKQTIGRGKNTNDAPSDVQQMDAQKELSVAKVPNNKLDSAWNDGRAAKIMSKPPEQRNAEEIKALAGELATANDGMARHVVGKMAAARGLHLATNYIQRHLGAKRSKEGKAEARADGGVRYATGLHGDMLQSARGTMYETLHNVLSGSQNPGASTSIAQHVFRRMKDKLHRDVYDMMNDLPAPHEMRGAIADMHSAEAELPKTLGRSASEEEIGAHLEANSKHFKTAPINKPSKWDEKAGDWVATKERYSDPTEKYRALKAYAGQQRSTSMDKNVGSEGEKAVTVADNARERTGANVEQQYEEKERQAELSDKLPKAMEAIGMKPEHILAYRVMFSQGSETGSKAHLTAEETAQRINEMGGFNGAPVTGKWVSNTIAAGGKVIQRAIQEKHPAMMALKDMLTKSFVWGLILKSLYEYDLIKSLSSWGVDHTILEQRFVRKETALDSLELRKSLEPHEYIGSYIVTDEGEYIANIVEYALPDNNELYKSFNMFMGDIRKSMFPHKGGGNAAINTKASEYVKANSGKYKALQSQQHAQIAGKKGELTWSEKLQKEKGGVWITWGGKRILINGESGEVLYDSANEAHRDEHNQGAQQDKLDFHHEKEAVSAHEKKREDALRTEWSGGDKKKQDAFAKKNRGVSFDEDGNLNFKADEGVNEDNAHHFDDGINAFKGELDKNREGWSDRKAEMVAKHKHKTIGMYGDFDDEQKKAYEDLGDNEAREKFVGDHLLGKEGMKDVLEKAKQLASEGKKGEEIQAALKGELDAMGTQHNSMGLKNSKMMTRLFNDMAKQKGNVDDDYLAKQLGKYEHQRAGEEANKRILDEGNYMIGNPITGKTMAVKIGHKVGGKSNRYTTYIEEAFDPETGDHFKGGEDADASWGQLGKALGIRDGASLLQENIVQHGNKDVDKPMVKQMSDEEWSQQRSKTRAGLQDSMLHKDFKKVNQERTKEKKDKDGNVTRKGGELISDTYAMTMPDGTTNHITTDAKGMIKDPLMQRILNQREPIKDENDLNDLMKRAAGNKVWVTAHFGRDIHVGDALGHHVQLEYDGKGAPVVRGGKYDGYRYMDAKDAKGAIDPATGEPIKALFKNGKLVDRKFTKVNNIDMKQGNPVMYPTGDGKFRKGRFHSEGEGGVKVTDGKGHVIGVFKKNELKHATSEGRMLSDSGNAVVKLGQTGAHRMDTAGAFKSDNPKEQKKLDKLKTLFQDALRKADVNQGAFGEDGELTKNMELSDQQHARLKKVLGRSKAGKALLAQIKSAYTPSLEVHVPEALRNIVASEGVTLHNNGIAKVSAAKFEQLRDVLNKNGSGISLDTAAQSYMQDHFSRKDRKPKTMDELKRKYQSFEVPDKGAGSFGNLYRGMFKPGSYVAEPYVKNKDGSFKTDADGNKIPGGLYSTQLEGLSHLIERKNAIAGHGMGTGKTILGVMAHAHYKAQKLANNQKPKKTLIVSPAGIMSDWGKEIGSHTNMKALYVGSAAKMKKTGKDGKLMQSENGRNMWGGDGLEHEAVSSKSFVANLQKHASEDHDFHIMSYDQFMKHRDALTASGMYDNIAIDEVHAFKNKTGQRGTALSESTAKFDNVWGLSGTPMENDAREVWSLVDTVTGGKHELGSEKEFRDTYMQKDKNGKIVGVKDKWASNTPAETRGTYQSPSEKLGDVLANVVQFRGGEDVQYNDGTNIKFPQLVGATSEDNPNPQHDFIANMVDRNRDHKTTDYYGTKHSVTDFEAGTKTVTSKSGDTYDVQTFKPVIKDAATKAMYDKYNELQQQILPESKLNELATAAATGYDQGQKGKSNYLTAMQKLQKFTNAPLTHKMYVPGAASALDAEDEGAPSKKGKKKAEPIPYETDSDGHKRYYESDGKGSYVKNADGSPKLLDPLHKQNPKAQYLHDRVHKYLDSLQSENRRRVANGEQPLMPKVVVKSSYTTFGTDIADSVLRDVQKSHPIFDDLKKMGFEQPDTGRFTGDADGREALKGSFRGDKNDYAKNQGSTWATTVSPAGKEGVDFGNAHLMLMYDQEWNPQRMAQFTARVRRSDSVKTHQQVGRSNSVRVESLHMPGTVEDFLFNAEDSKMNDIQQVTKNTRTAEDNPKLGETQGSIGYGHRGFTTKKNPKRVPKDAQGAGTVPKAPKTKAPKPVVAASVAKSIQFVIMNKGVSG